MARKTYGRVGPAAAACGFALLTTFASAPAVAAEAPDKSVYTLLNPTPRALMRDLTADRPDTTESPFTVDAGHVQVELSFAEWRTGGGAEELAVFPTNVKLGLTNNVDAQVVLNPYLRSVAGGATDQGHGDAQLRLKVNLWGNDGGDTVLAIMPYVQFPTGADAFSNDDRVEGGLIVPFLVSLPAEFSLTVMAELDFVRDGGGGYDTLLVHTASLGREIAGPLGGYVEYVGVAAIDGGDEYTATLGAGLTYLVNPDLQFDAGVDVGLNGPADDLRFFAGMTLRI